MKKFVPVLLALFLSGCISFGPQGASAPSFATNLVGRFHGVFAPNSKHRFR